MRNPLGQGLSSGSGRHSLPGNGLLGRTLQMLVAASIAAMMATTASGIGVKVKGGLDAETLAGIEKSMEQVVAASKGLDPIGIKTLLQTNADLRADLEIISGAVKSSMGSGALELTDQLLVWRVANYVGELRVEASVRSLASADEAQDLFQQTLPLRTNQDGVRGKGCSYAFVRGVATRWSDAQSWTDAFAALMREGRTPRPEIPDATVNGAIPKSGLAELKVAVWPLKQVDDRWGIVWELVAVDRKTNAEQVVAWYTQNNAYPGRLADDMKNAQGVAPYVMTAPLVVGLSREETPAAAPVSQNWFTRIFGGLFRRDLPSAARALADTITKVDPLGIKTVLADNAELRAQLLTLQREVDAETGAGAYPLTQEMLYWNAVKYSGAMRVTLSVQTGSKKVPVAEIEYPNLESRQIRWPASRTPCKDDKPVPTPAEYMTKALTGVAEPAGTQTRKIWLNPRFPTSGLHGIVVDVTVSELDSTGHWSLEWELVSSSMNGKESHVLRHMNPNSEMFSSKLGVPYSQTTAIMVSGSMLTPLFEQ